MRLYFSYRKLVDYVFAVIVAGLVYFQPFSNVGIFAWPDRGLVPSVALSFSSSSAALLGFVLAASTFLVSHTQHRRLAMLRKSNGFDQLLQIMRSNLWRLLLLTIYAGAGSLVAPKYVEIMLVGLAFTAALSLAGLIALIWSTMAVLSIPLD